jgi:hypothetical protein
MRCSQAWNGCRPLSANPFGRTVVPSPRTETPTRRSL